MDKAIRSQWAATARRLAYFTIGYNLLEAGVCAVFGLQDSSLSLLGFGADSLMEAASGAVVLWRFSREGLEGAGEVDAEHLAQKIIGALLLGLAGTLALGALWSLWQGKGPENGLAGTVISLVSLSIMWALFNAKMKVATALGSAVLSADAFCTKSCMWLSAVLLGGSFLLSTTHYAWFDALASLGMAWLVGREGLENWQGEDHCDDGACELGRPTTRRALMTRTQWNLLIDALALLAFLAMLSSGWIMQFDLPQGSPSRGWNVLGWDRHGWGVLHEKASLAFIGLLVVHFVLHWEWVLCMSKGGTQAPLSRRRAGLLVLGVMLVLGAMAAAAPFILPIRQGSVAAEEGHDGAWGRGGQ